MGVEEEEIGGALMEGMGMRFEFVYWELELEWREIVVK